MKIIGEACVLALNRFLTAGIYVMSVLLWLRILDATGFYVPLILK